MNKLFIPILIFSVVSSSCSENKEDSTSESTATTSQQNEVLSTENLEVQINNPMEGEINFTGFIGNSPISAYLDFNEEKGMILGYYYYDKYEKKIALSGLEVDWHGGPVYSIDEFADSVASGFWLSFKENSYGIYSGEFESMDGHTVVDIVLKSIDVDGYLHPSSQMIFSDKSDAEQFFKTNHFQNNNSKLRAGVILHEQSEDEYLNGPKLLPAGINVYTHDGGDGFGVVSNGTVTKDNMIQFDDGSEYGLYDWESGAMMEIDYEFQCLRFQKLISPEYVLVQTGNKDFYLSVNELEKKGYYLEGDGYWTTQKSGYVLGYYPTETVNVFPEKDKYGKQLLTVSHDGEGFFQVKDVVNFRGDVWAEVDFVYHTSLPCEGIEMDPKPTVSGWILLYGGDNEDQLNLGFYSRGC